MKKIITMACNDGQLRPGYGVHDEEITMACNDGQLRPGYGVHDTKNLIKTLKKVA